jgi:hypothetical protein
MTLSCAKCGAAIERTPGPGRTPSYCGDLCKRLIEYEVRRIDRRLGRYELELRELKADTDPLDEDARQRRLRALRRWIRQDEERLQILLGGGRGNRDNPPETPRGQRSHQAAAPTTPEGT